MAEFVNYGGTIYFQTLDFVTHRSQMLEATGKASSSAAKVDTRPSAKLKRQAACTASIKLKCAHCKEEHSIYFCPKFLALTIHQRIAEVRKAKLCANYLRSTTHDTSKCVPGSCKACKMKHNSLLHIDSSSGESQGRNEKSQEAETSMALSTTVVTLQLITRIQMRRLIRNLQTRLVWAICKIANLRK